MKKGFSGSGLRKVVTEEKTTFFAFAMGQWVEISEEVYKFMAASARRERYHYACCRDMGVLSLDQMVERMDDSTDSVPMCEALIGDPPDADCLKEEANKKRAEMVAAVKHAISTLTGDEYELASSILLNGKSIRNYASEHELTRKTVRYHYYAVCRKIREICLEGQKDD